MYKKLITLLIIGVAISSTYTKYCCTGSGCDDRSRCLDEAPKKMAKAAPIKEVGKGSAKPAPKPVLKKAADIKIKPVGGKGSLPPMPKPQLKKAVAKPVKPVGGKGSLPPKKAPKRKHHGKRRHHAKRKHHGKRKGGFFHKMAHHFHHFHKFIRHHFKRMSKRFRKAHNKLKAKLAAAKSKAKKGSKKAKAEVKKVKKELKKDAKKAAKAAPKKDAKKPARFLGKKKADFVKEIMEAKKISNSFKRSQKMTAIKAACSKAGFNCDRRLNKHVKNWKDKAANNLNKCKGKKGKKNCDDKNNGKGHDDRRLNKHVKNWKDKAANNLNKCKGKKGKKNCDDKNNGKGHDDRRLIGPKQSAAKAAKVKQMLVAKAKEEAEKSAPAKALTYSKKL